MIPDSLSHNQNILPDPPKGPVKAVDVKSAQIAAASIKSTPSSSNQPVSSKTDRNTTTRAKADQASQAQFHPYQKQAREHPNFYQDSDNLVKVTSWIKDSNKKAEGNKYPFPVHTWVLRPSNQGARYLTLQFLLDPLTWQNIRIEITDRGYLFNNKIYTSIEDCVKATGVSGPPLESLFSSLREKCMHEQPPYFIKILHEVADTFCGVELTPENVVKKLREMWDKAKCEGPLPFYYDASSDRLVFNMSKAQLKACGYNNVAFREFFGSRSSNQKTAFEGFISMDSPFSLSCSFPDEEFRTTMLVHEAHWKLSQITPSYASLSRPKEATPEACISEWLKNEHVDGVFIGEFHDNASSKSFLIDNMQKLKEAGVTTLFMEFIEYDGAQKALDTYLKSKNPQADVPPEVSGYLKESDDLYKFQEKKSPGLMNLVRAAKAAGIRVVGLESEATKFAGYTSFGSEGPERLAALNYNSKKIIEKEKGAGKYVALMGIYHVVDSKEAVGMSKIMGAPSMFLFDKDKPSNRGIQQGFDVVPDKDSTSKIHASFSR